MKNKWICWLLPLDSLLFFDAQLQESLPLRVGCARRETKQTRLPIYQHLTRWAEILADKTLFNVLLESNWSDCLVEVDFAVFDSRATISNWSRSMICLCRTYTLSDVYFEIFHMNNQLEQDGWQIPNQERRVVNHVTFVISLTWTLIRSHMFLVPVAKAEQKDGSSEVGELKYDKQYAERPSFFFQKFELFLL